MKHGHRPTGNLSITAFERAVAASHGDFDEWDAWMDFRLTLRGRSLDGLVAMWKTASRPEASANSPSSTPRQQQIKLRAASSLGPASANRQMGVGWPALPALFTT